MEETHYSRKPSLTCRESITFQFFFLHFWPNKQISFLMNEPQVKHIHYLRQTISISSYSLHKVLKTFRRHLLQFRKKNSVTLICFPSVFVLHLALCFSSMALKLLCMFVLLLFLYQQPHSANSSTCVIFYWNRKVCCHTSNFNVHFEQRYPDHK